MDRWLDGWIVNHLNTPQNFKQFASNAGFRKSNYSDVTKSVFLTSKLMYYVSFLFLPLHLIDKFIKLKPYPTDALFNQYKAIKKNLWEYGVFYAEK